MKPNEFKAGILICKPIREYLNKRISLGANFSFFESKGLFQRTFTIKGDAAVIKTILTDLNEWYEATVK